MRKAFTLIEVLVVLILIALVTSVVAPKGYKLLESVSNKIDSKEKSVKIKLLKYDIFISENNMTIENNITINKLGIAYDY